MDERRAYIDLLIEEFRSLAEGSHQAGRHTYTALQWGTAIVAIIVGAAISQWGKEDAVVELVFLIGVPSLIAVGMLYWIGELAGIRRIHDFMCIVEAKADLALTHPGPDSGSDSRWFDSFKRAWTAECRTLLAQLHLKPGASVESGPLAHERWLRAGRNAEGGDTHTWVFIVRFAFFPVAIIASWATGLYYVLFQSAQHGFRWPSLSATLLGLLLTVTTVWLAAELVDDLNSWSGRSSSHLSWPRRRFRQILGGPLRMVEWGAKSRSSGKL